MWHPYTGYIDEVSIFDRALSKAEIATLYNKHKPPQGDRNGD